MVKKRSLASKLQKAARFARNLQSPMEVVRLAMPERYHAERVLNDKAPSKARGHGEIEAGEVVRRLKELRNTLKADSYVIESGGVDYARLAGSDAFQNLEEVSYALRWVDPLTIAGDDARKAFWINLYNVMMIHGVIALGIQKSVMEVPSFFSTVAYRVGGRLITPDDIEHGILRLNQPGPGKGRVPFEERDERRAWSPSTLDARVHMALVCVSRGCPPIAFYEASSLEAQLDLASFAFVSGGADVDHDEKTVMLSKIFQFYTDDFGGMDGVKAFVLKYAEDDHKEAVERAFREGYTLDFMEYDWSLNSI